MGQDVRSVTHAVTEFEERCSVLLVEVLMFDQERRFSLSQEDGRRGHRLTL